MQLLLSKEFKKHVKKLSIKKRDKVQESIKKFLKDPSAPTLRHHALKGKYEGVFSLSAGGDLRIHYRKISDEEIVLITVGTHSQLYK
jgi:addiction module RelE/StbE family toxin